MKATRSLRFETPFQGKAGLDQRQKTLEGIGVKVTEDFDEAVGDCDAIMILGKRYHDLALEMAEKCADPVRAEELRQICAIIPPSEAKPGDLIFFQGTYDTDGASHVGIYVGNNTMMHCGHPVQYASLDTDYWRAHFYCFGRLP